MPATRLRPSSRRSSRDAGLERVVHHHCHRQLERRRSRVDRSSRQGCDARGRSPLTRRAPRYLLRPRSDGGITTVSKTFKIDKTAPGVTPTPAARPTQRLVQPRALRELHRQRCHVRPRLLLAPQTYSGPDSAVRDRHGSCTDMAGNYRQAPSRSSTTRRRRRLPAGARLARRTANGWYNHALTVSFSGSDATSGLGSCSRRAYSGPDSAARASPAPAPTTPATRATALRLKYDETDAADERRRPSRAPDSNGWYNHALTVGFTGSDATSGVDTCTAPRLLRPGHRGRLGERLLPRSRRQQSAAQASRSSYDATAPQVTGTSPSRSRTRTAGTTTRSPSASRAATPPPASTAARRRPTRARTTRRPRSAAPAATWPAT